MRGDFKMALTSLRAAKWRSLLTMVGIIIGVSSVVTVVSLGEGLKQQLAGQINQLGSEIVSVRSGKVVNKDTQGNITSFNPLAAFSASTLTNKDVEAIRANPNVELAVPFSLVTNTVTDGQVENNSAFVLGTTGDVPEVLNRKINYGAFFNDNEQQRNYAVVGQSIAYSVFNEQNPVGKTIKIMGNDFIVHGVFEEFSSTGFLGSGGLDFNSAVFIPNAMAQQITEGKAQIQQVLVQRKASTNADSVVESLRVALLQNHKGQEDFTILKQQELLNLADSVLDIVTAFISGIAAISLIVGGIGVMNIMLVNVTERTREIGVRKAIGATDGQIMSQFLVEGVIISVTGGIIGIILALGAGVVLRIITDFEPVITAPIILLATSVSVFIGILFSLTPALKAAHKDPIEALRGE